MKPRIIRTSRPTR